MIWTGNGAIYLFLSLSELEGKYYFSCISSHKFVIILDGMPEQKQLVL